MRTTIEISDRHRGILLAMAARKGLRGYSEIIEEALEQYIASQIDEPEKKEKVLAMFGSCRT
jgi:metal-responsive CopG/Arc/MetJ family transcriptional regulator